jgi:uncharacterized protein (TIGR03435 family)
MHRIAFPVAVSAIALGLCSAVLRAQSTAPLAFEVASIRENTSVSDAGGISGPTPGRFTVTNSPLRFVIMYAFGLLDHELIDAPEWTVTTRYDITATYPDGTTPTEANVRAMLQRLLADRFNLRARRERRDMPAYDLVLARANGQLGPQLARSNVDCDKWIAEKRPQFGAGGPSPVTPAGTRPACLLVATRTYLSGGTRTIAQLTPVLQSMVRRPVIDKTGLTGTFDIDLRWSPAGDARAVESVAADEAASIFTALQEQLGLKLETSRAPFDVVIIESLQRPSAD